MIAAAAAVRATQVVDVSGLAAGEVPRVSVLSLTIDLARVVFGHIVGTINARPMLRALLIGEPTSDTVTLRHPTGRAIEIKVVAGSKAGSSVVARWCAGLIADEAPRMSGADDGVVNFDDTRAAASGRMLRGAAILAIGSPWAPSGPLYESYREHHGKPTADLVVVKAPGWVMNPVHWTPERCAELQRRNPQAYVTDCAAEFAQPESSLLSEIDLEVVTRTVPIETAPRPGVHTYVAAMDPATRGNSWTLVIGHSERVADGGPRYVVDVARQWTGSRRSPLSPAETLKRIAEIAIAYGVRELHTDQHAADALRDLARPYGLIVKDTATTGASKLEMFEALRIAIASRAIELPPGATLRSDLLSIRKRVAQSGGYTIETPRTADGRHADYASALALFVMRAHRPYEPYSSAIGRGSRRYDIGRAHGGMPVGVNGLVKIGSARARWS
jgi:hypothetical protein